MSDTLALENKINEAAQTLLKTFGDVITNEEGSVSYFSLKDLSEVYQKEEVFTAIAEELSLFGREVRSMRSSYLPIDFFKNPDVILSPSLSTDLGMLESYENAFMRLLGLPQSELLDFAAGSSGDGDLKYVLSNGTLSSNSFTNIETAILNQRAKSKTDRQIRINDFIYNLDKTAPEVTEESSIEDAETAQEVFPKITTLEDNIFQFSYLLFPPIQDSRYSKCINESGKNVSPLFSNKRSRQINAKRIKPSLLESIIRIRIDRLSGQDALSRLAPESDEGLSVDVGTSEEEESVQPFAENYGILEALFVLRLRSALSGLAKKFVSDREHILELMSRTEQIITETSGGSDPQIPDGDGSKASSTIPLEQLSTKEKMLRTQLLLEDSIFALFGDNSEVLDLQLNTQRNSSIHDAHLMSGLFSIIDIPRKRIGDELNDMIHKKNERRAAELDPIRKKINTVFGVDIGVGNIDMIIFALAMFTMSESGLINLLSDSEYDRMKKTSIGDAIDTIADRRADGIIDAVNELTELAYAGYNIFVKDLKNTDVV